MYQNWLRIMMFLSLFISSLAHAYSNPNVTAWTQRILMDTFSTSYRETNAEIFAVQKNYSPAAWVPLNEFFNHELKIIKKYKLSSHPRPLMDPIIVKAGHLLGAECWRVTQSFNIPELHMNIACSVLVMNNDKSKETPYLIQSIDMKIRHY